MEPRDLERQVAELETTRGKRVHVEESVEDRRAGDIARWPEVLDQQLERQVLVRVGAHRRLAHTVEQLAKRRIAREVQPKDERVHEEADQRGQLRPIPSGVGRTHQHVVLPGIVMEKHAERGQQRHEGRHTLVAAEHAQRA